MLVASCSILCSALLPPALSFPVLLLLSAVAGLKHITLAINVPCAQSDSRNENKDADRPSTSHRPQHPQRPQGGQSTVETRAPNERVENVFASAVIKLDFFLSALLGVVPSVEEGFLLPGLRTVIPR